MGLDIYLKLKDQHVSCPHCGHDIVEDQEVFDTNITHNLGKMADAAGIYEALWKPEEISATKAKDIVELVRAGLNQLKEKPEHFKQFSAENGWGTYEQFVPWVEKYLEALERYPEAEIRVSR